MSPLIDILLPTYNGEYFLEDQIKSILSQNYQSFRILLADDCSSDNTVNIIHKYINTYPDKIELLYKADRNQGAKRSFSSLLEKTRADYIMFSDQDDVWLPEKIEKTYLKMTELEKKYGKDMPLLVHTDMKVVDENLNILSNSYWLYQNLAPNIANGLSRLMVQNVITGCTVMINKKLRELALPVPKEAIMHDWWIGIVASAFGKIDFIEEPTVLYRQHRNNEIGAKPWGIYYILRELFNFSDIKIRLLATEKQAGAFLDKYKDILGEENFKMISIFSSLEERGFLEKRFYILKYSFLKVGFFRNIGLFLIV